MESPYIFVYMVGLGTGITIQKRNSDGLEIS
jgi:hypothetical protein